MNLWVVVVAVAVISAAMKAAGPVLLLDRTFPLRTAAVIDALAPALLTGLIVVELLGPRWREVDWTVLPGLGLAGVLWFLKLPDVICIVVAVAATVAVRLLVT